MIRQESSQVPLGSKAYIRGGLSGVGFSQRWLSFLDYLDCDSDPESSSIKYDEYDCEHENDARGLTYMPKSGFGICGMGPSRLMTTAPTPAMVFML